MALFIDLLQLSLGTREDLPRVPYSCDWESLLRLAEQQAVVGLLFQGLNRGEIKQLPSKDVILQWISEVRVIQLRNNVMDKAVVSLCESLSKEDIRFSIVKGQTIAALYPEKSVRQSGDIDFLVHPDDWNRSVAFIKHDLEQEVQDSNSTKHVEWRTGDVQYEMHRTLTTFARPRYRNYWKNVVESEIWGCPCTVCIDDFEVPTLSPVYNNLYVFVHIFQHLISDGIGLRQFCDWFYLNQVYHLSKDDKLLLDKHLKGIGMKKAYVGLGAILTDYLGLKAEDFPFEISEQAHRRAKLLMNNILEYGNFGHNKHYARNSGVLHGIQHLVRIIRQSCLFGHYAPGEVIWKIPDMIRWWGQKVSRKARR